MTPLWSVHTLVLALQGIRAWRSSGQLSSGSDVPHVPLPGAIRIRHAGGTVDLLMRPKIAGR
jgi:hypothetical protein